MYTLRLSREEVLRTTPAQFDAMLKLYEEERGFDDYFTARIYHLLLNAWRDVEKAPNAIDLIDVMVFKPSIVRVPKQEGEDWREQKEKWKAFTERSKMRMGG